MILSIFMLNKSIISHRTYVSIKGRMLIAAGKEYFVSNIFFYISTQSRKWFLSFLHCFNRWIFRWLFLNFLFLFIITFRILLIIISSWIKLNIWVYFHILLDLFWLLIWKFLLVLWRVIFLIVLFVFFF